MTTSTFSVSAGSAGATVSNASGAVTLASGDVYGPIDLYTYGPVQIAGSGKASITPGSNGAIVNGSTITTPHSYALGMVSAQDGATGGIGGSSPPPPPPPKH